jgi:hypothetical protein
MVADDAVFAFDSGAVVQRMVAMSLGCAGNTHDGRLSNTEDCVHAQCSNRRAWPRRPRAPARRPDRPHRRCPCQSPSRLIRSKVSTTSGISCWVSRRSASTASSIRSAGTATAKRKTRRSCSVGMRNSPFPRGANMTSYVRPIRRISIRPTRGVMAYLPTGLPRRRRDIEADTCTLAAQPFSKSRAKLTASTNRTVGRVTATLA